MHPSANSSRAAPEALQEERHARVRDARDALGAEPS
jgi:hypothetical protein